MLTLTLMISEGGFKKATGDKVNENLNPLLTLTLTLSVTSIRF